MTDSAECARRIGQFKIATFSCLSVCILSMYAYTGWKVNDAVLWNHAQYSWYFVTTVRKNCSIDGEKLLKFEAEGREFSKILRSLEQFIQTVKGQNNFW